MQRTMFKKRPSKKKVKHSRRRKKRHIVRTIFPPRNTTRYVVVKEGDDCLISVRYFSTVEPSYPEMRMLVSVIANDKKVYSPVENCTSPARTVQVFLSTDKKGDNRIDGLYTWTIEE